MHRRSFLPTLAGTLLIAGGAGADGFPVGLTTIQIADPEGLRPLNVQVFYPAETDQVPTELGGNQALFGFEAVADAPRVSGAFPLVLTSHGLYGRCTNQGWLAAKLAADGKVVASPNLKFLLYESVTHCSDVLLLVNGYQLLGTVRVGSGRLGPSGPRCLVDICVRQHGQL